VTGSTSLLMAFAVIAASLLGGCSDKIIGVAGSDDAARLASPRHSPHLEHANQTVAAAVSRPAVSRPAASSPTVVRLASAALDDAKLSDVRGGYDTSSGVTVNFAFQQATYVNHNLAQSVVIPTLTISPGQGTVAAAGLQQLTGGTGMNSSTVVANGTVQTQVGAANSMVQALVNSGMASAIGSSRAGNSGVTTTLANTANNQLIQQMNTIDIGVNGLSKLMQQSIPASVLGRIAGPSTFR
jgi:hypothetical protein